MDDPKLNVNTASAVQLLALKGIGPSLAEAIVAHREVHGPFETVDDLASVRGLSDRIVAQFADRVTVADDVPEEDEPTALALAPDIEWQPLEPRDEPIAEPESSPSDWDLSIDADQSAEVEPSVEAETLAESQPLPEPEAEPQPLPPVEPQPAVVKPSYMERLEQLAESSSSADWRTIYTAAGGAVLGALLTLSFLLLLNGTLRFGARQRVTNIEAALEAQTGTLVTEQGLLTSGLATLEAQLQAVEATGEISAEAITTLQADIAVRQAEVATVAAFANNLEVRMDNVLTAGENLGLFLEGMDNLLDEINPEPTSTPTATPTATSGADATATAQPTRTPRPTATPIASGESDE